MGRWEPDAPGRLAEAAMSLYAEQGFDRTTVAEIAERAGVTERTFFRHYADKREVLFAGGALLHDVFVDTIAALPAEVGPLDAVASALDTAGAFFDGRHAFSKQRHQIITASTELQERELAKMAMLGAALAGALRARGVPDGKAALAAEAGIAVFRVAFERWVGAKRSSDFGDHLRACFDDLRSVTAPS